jgi:hypothetical protein
MKRKIFLALSFSFVLLSAVKAQKDPWITQAYRALYSRIPTDFEYNIHNYNDGHWNTYNDLATYIVQFQNAQKTAGCTIKCISLGNCKSVAELDINGLARAVDIISQDGGSLVAQGGGNLVAQGAGNIVTNASSNLQNLPGFKFGAATARATASGAVIKTSGSGAIIIQ